MKSRSIVRILLLSGFASLGAPALASDELAGALIGAGTGALIGNSIDRHEGAVIGGIFGAILGAAIADDDHRYRDPSASPRHPHQYYGPAPVVYQAPRVRYIEQPIIVEHRPSPYRWKEDRRGRHEYRWDRDRERRNDDRRDRRDRRDW
jgi:hypothetical protein